MKNNIIIIIIIITLPLRWQEHYYKNFKVTIQILKHVSAWHMPLSL